MAARVGRMRVRAGLSREVENILSFMKRWNQRPLSQSPGNMTKPGQGF
jgi:hypothetical protein